MLKSVRWAGGRDCVRNVHWLKALAAATIMAASGPTRSSAAKSIAYETDMVAPPLVSGRFTLNTEAADDVTRRTRTSRGSSSDRGMFHHRTHAAAASTAATKRRARTGRCFIGPALRPRRS